ncbi:ABC transporter permease [Variovorax sp. dw_954]|uniref:ABC transporter permease n=1 Tax=Variovorax sp. dw_954 TaxID=2720078 RepID=UPI001BD4A0B5|nr:ABC transporter permease [Variovorax sp. dw_954]
MLTSLIKKELIALVRDVHGLAALFLMPVIFIVVMSLALKDYYNPPLTALRYAVRQHDNGVPAQSILADWKRAHGTPQDLPADWQAQLTNGQLKYVIVLQPGLSDALNADTLPTVPLMRLLAEPGIDGNLFNALRAELVGVAGEVKGRLEASVAGGPPAPPGASMATLLEAERFAPSGPRPTAVQQSVPAWLVFGMFFVVASMSSLFIQERASGTLGRLRSLGVPTGMLLVSKALPYLGVNALQAALMLAVGVWLMPLLGGDALSLAGIHWDALVVALVAIGLAAVSLSLALACAVRTHAQAATVGPVANVLMAAVGGIMVPKFVMPAAMQHVAEWSPMNWGLEALLTALLRGGGLAEMLPELVRLLVFSAVMLALAALLFQRRAA